MASEAQSTSQMLRREVAWWWLVITGLITSLSVVSILQRAYALELLPLFSELIEFYRKAVCRCFDLLFFWVNFTVPSLVKEFFALGLLYFGFLYRIERPMFQENGIGFRLLVALLFALFVPAMIGVAYFLRGDQQTVNRLVVLFLAGIFVVTPIQRLAVATIDGERRAELPGYLMRYTITVGTILIVTIVAFATNYPW